MALAEDIAALEAAIRQGVSEVTYDGRRVAYRSLDEMRTILADMKRQQAGAVGPVRTVYGFDRGWR